MTRSRRGVRTCDTRAGTDPDAPLCPLTPPASWDDRAAALTARASGDGGTGLPRATQAWVCPIAARDARAAGGPASADRLHAGAHPAATPPGFVPNSPALHDPAHGFDAACFAGAARDAATAPRQIAPHAQPFAATAAPTRRARERRCAGPWTTRPPPCASPHDTASRADDVAAFALPRFGSAGRVERDPTVVRAIHHLGRRGPHLRRPRSRRLPHAGGRLGPEGNSEKSGEGRATPGHFSAFDPAPLSPPSPLDPSTRLRARRLGLRSGVDR